MRIIMWKTLTKKDWLGSRVGKVSGAMIKTKNFNQQAILIKINQIVQKNWKKVDQN